MVKFIFYSVFKKQNFLSESTFEKSEFGKKWERATKLRSQKSLLSSAFRTDDSFSLFASALLGQTLQGGRFFGPATTAPGSTHPGFDFDFFHFFPALHKAGLFFCFEKILYRPTNTRESDGEGKQNRVSLLPFF